MPRRAPASPGCLPGEKPLPGANSHLQEFGFGSCWCCIPNLELGLHLRTGRICWEESGCIPMVPITLLIVDEEIIGLDPSLEPSP